MHAATVHACAVILSSCPDSVSYLFEFLQGAAEKSGNISVGEVLLAVDDVTGKACSVSRQVFKPGTDRTCDVSCLLGVP